MFIRAYLRASTEDQFADRAKEMLEQFVQQRGHKIASYYRENISGTKLDRPELGRLLMDSHHNDILLVEQIDRLTRLSNSDWMTLKKQIEKHELRIVSLDVPTSWQALSDKDPSQADPITRAVITAINNMLIDLMAAMLCGYRSTSYFISVFKTFYGMTPLHYVTQYRQQYITA